VSHQEGDGGGRGTPRWHGGPSYAVAVSAQHRRSPARVDTLEALRTDIITCRRCPRLVAWREEVARTRRAAFANEEYWGRPVPGFGDPMAAVLLVGLAPAAHGGNRTGRVFTGDRSGDWLIAALWRTGYANQPTSSAVDDGLELSGAYIAAAVRCAPPANAPTPLERDTCLPFLRRELALLGGVRVVLALGEFAYRVACTELGVRPRPRFGHGVEVRNPGGLWVVASYHPSQQNTFTGTLTEAMLDAVLTRARALAAPGGDGAGGAEP
jgi:uracil-DNA glycosylase